MATAIVFVVLLLLPLLLLPLLLLQVMAEMTPASLQAMLCRLFPHPCRSRYTAITMMPRPPGIIGRLAFKWATASSSTQIAVAVAGVGVLVAAAAAVGVAVARRRAAQ
jgi:hypothetical protein